MAWYGRLLLKLGAFVSRCARHIRHASPTAKAAGILLPALVMFCSVQATAGTIYENGPVNGHFGAWEFTGSLFVSNTFTVSTGDSTVNGISIWVQIFMTDHSPNAEVAITSQPNGGTVYFDQMVQFTESSCYANGWGYNICEETANWTGGPLLPDGTYWITLKRGSVGGAGNVWWSQNSGADCVSQGCPSQAEASFGTVPSEAFTVLGTSGSGQTATSPKATILLLFGTGFVGLLGFVRSKLRW